MCNSTSYPENMETWKILLMLGKCCLVDDGKLEGKKFMSFEEIRCKKISIPVIMFSVTVYNNLVFQGYQSNKKNTETVM